MPVWSMGEVQATCSGTEVVDIKDAEADAKVALRAVQKLEKASGDAKELFGGEQEYQKRLLEARARLQETRAKADQGLPLLDRIRKQGNKLAGAANKVKQLEAAEKDAAAGLASATTSAAASSSAEAPQEEGDSTVRKGG